MDSSAIFIKLRNILVALYLQPDDAQRIAADAGLELAHISFSPKAIHNWHNILAQAVAEGKLNVLLAAIQTEYPTNVEFASAHGLFHKFINAGGAFYAPPALGVSYIIKIEHGYYDSSQPSPRPLSATLDELDDHLSLLSAGRTDELASLHEHYKVVLVDKEGKQPRLLVVTGEAGMGQQALLQQWLADLRTQQPSPIIAATSYLPRYIGKEEQEFYYADHPGWRSAWAQYAATLRSRYRHTESLGGLAWVALAAQLVQQSKSAQARLAQSAVLVGDVDQRTIQRQMSDLLLAAVDDAPLVLILDHIDNAHSISLQSLLYVWRNLLYNRPFLLVVTADIPHLHYNVSASVQENDWLRWLRKETALHDTTRARYVHVGPFRLDSITHLLAKDAQEFAATLHYTTNGSPALLQELLRHWQQQGDAERGEDGRWSIHNQAFGHTPGALYQYYIVEPLQDCTLRAQELGYDLTWEELLEWLHYAVWESDVFTDEALAYAVNMHGENLETFQEILDEVLAYHGDEADARGLLIELAETVVLPTAELERRERHMAQYRFEPPLLASILYYRQQGQERVTRGMRYVNALQFAYQPFVDRIAPTLVQICQALERHNDADAFLSLIAPTTELQRSEVLLASMRALATDQFGMQQIVRYVLQYFDDVYGRVHPRPLLPLLQETLHFAQILNQPKNTARLLHSIGSVYSDLGEKQEALAYHTQALPLLRQVGNRGSEAATLSNIGLVYADLGEKQEALAYYTQALPLHRQVGNRRGEAATLSNIGTVYSALGEKQEALAYYTQALPLQRQIGDRRGEATTLTSIGRVYSDLGEKQEALAYHTQALPLQRQIGDRRGEATTLSNIGGIYSALGEKQEALAYHTQALPLLRQVGDRRGEAITLNNIGIVYSILGEKQEALAYYTQALPLRRQVGDRGGEANTRCWIATILFESEEYERAEEEISRAIALYAAIHDPNLSQAQQLLESIQHQKKQHNQDSD